MVARLPEYYPHLSLARADVQLDRRRRGVGPAPDRDSTQHGRRIAQGVEDVLRRFQLPRLPEAVDPALIFKVRLEGNIEDDDWRRNELVVLSREPARNLVLFSTDTQLTEFRSRLDAYQAGVQPGRRHPAYNGLFNAIVELVPLDPADRLGPQLAAVGIDTNATYSVDVELWPLGDTNQRQSRAQQVENYVRQQGGDVLDRVINESMVILRVRAAGALLEQLLTFEVVAILDLPPQPTLPVANVLNVTLQDLPPIPAPPDGASVCVVDSGVDRGHPLLGPAIGDTDVFPASIGTPDDGHGHGSMVAGIAVYNDIEACIQTRLFAPQVRLFSSRVTNDQNRFDDNTLIMTQMREAITRFAREGCRVFNVSLGDESRVFSDGRLSPWAAILDTLARELNVLIVVSAGNRSTVPDEPPGAARQQYPHYLLDEESRIIDPATAALAVTVGSLSGPGSPYHAQRYPNDPAYQRIALQGQPSAFTRRGPGQQGSVKPEFCEFGRDFSCDGRMHQVETLDQGLSPVSLNHQPLDRLFAFMCGTSFASPRVAHMAALLFREFPQGGPNLVRVLLALSASIPQAATSILTNETDQLRICGYGQPDLERALHSTTNRVVLTAEDEVQLDSFHVYELPVPQVFNQTRGDRRLAVSLAFYPPVRHSRIDYLGARMSFRLVRGKSLEEVAAAYRLHGADEGDPPTVAGTKYQPALSPNTRSRDFSTLQKGEMLIRQNPAAEYGETYYIVVRSERIWAPEEVSHQQYALGVVLEHLSSPIDLYAAVRQRVTARVRVNP